MNKYEGVFIFFPDVEEEKRNQTFDRVKALIEKDGAIDEVDEWGIKKLAYEIEDYREGYYRIVRFSTTPATLAEVDRVLRISDPVMRHMMIRLEDE